MQFLKNLIKNILGMGMFLLLFVLLLGLMSIGGYLLRPHQLEFVGAISGFFLWMAIAISLWESA